jgi:hypothetical protein
MLRFQLATLTEKCKYIRETLNLRNEYIDRQRKIETEENFNKLRNTLGGSVEQ